MARIVIAAVVALCLLTAPLAADQMLQNPDVAQNTTNTTTQDELAQTAGGDFLEATPILLAALVVGAILAAVRRVG